VTELKIEGLSAETVEEFLRFLYTENLTETKKDFDELFALSSKMKVEKLKTISEQNIIDDINETNAFEIFFKKSAFDQIKKKFRFRRLPDSFMNEPEKLKAFLSK
jgi:BTB/POZ domain